MQTQSEPASAEKRTRGTSHTPMMSHRIRSLTPWRSRDERGSISVWFATASFAMIILVGMAVDLGGKVHTQQQARSAASQAGPRTRRTAR